VRQEGLCQWKIPMASSGSNPQPEDFMWRVYKFFSPFKQNWMYQKILVATHPCIRYNKSPASGFRVTICKQTDTHVGRVFATVLYERATKEGRRRTSSKFLNAFQELHKAFIHILHEEFRNSSGMFGRDTSAYSLFRWNPLRGRR
jgi:hypothetical protein